MTAVLPAETWADGAEARRQLGRFGVWFGDLSRAPWAVARDAAQRIEALGYTTLWLNEGPGWREPLSHAGLLLGATDSITVATGIANIYARDAVAARDGAYSLAEAHPGRFALGLGVSHQPLVDARGHTFGKPVTAMRAYLDGLDALPYAAAAPDSVPLLLAALRDRMLGLAAERTSGAHPYLVPVSHTARARVLIGPEPVLAPEVSVVLDADADRARRRARAFVAPYLGYPNYLASLHALGYQDTDLAGGGSDALIDALVFHGNADTVAVAITTHLAAGADHVAIQIVGLDSIPETVGELTRLAAALCGK